MTLTEQWKNGKLDRGYYYFRNVYGNVRVSEFAGNAIYDDFYDESEVKEVLIHIPTIEKLQKNEKENQQLKELLKEAKDIIEWYKADCGYKDTPTEAILTKIDNAIGEKK